MSLWAASYTVWLHNSLDIGEVLYLGRSCHSDLGQRLTEALGAGGHQRFEVVAMFRFCLVLTTQ
jgi:hypothetical protein